jgi:hypothetical protein
VTGPKNKIFIKNQLTLLCSAGGCSQDRGHPPHWALGQGVEEVRPEEEEAAKDN